MISPPLVIGLVYETFDTYRGRPGDPEDFAVEYEPEATVAVLSEALESLGHRVLRLGSPHALLAALASGRLPKLDAALSIAEGYGSRNREAWAPVLLEMAGVPCLGSDALSLSLSLDKAWTHRMVASAGLPVAPQRVVGSAAEAERCDLPAPFPLFVKPRWEGAAKGIRPTSRVVDRAGLVREVARIVRDYQQPALVEAFLEGSEYTVTVVGHAPPRALPVVQRALEVETRIGLHALEGPGSGRGRAFEHCLPGVLTPQLEAELRELALHVYALLDCRDFARADFRLDAAGRPVFLEINPLPTFAPDGTFALLAELEGRPLAALLADVFADALRRLGLPSPGAGARGEG